MRRLNIVPLTRLTLPRLANTKRLTAMVFNWKRNGVKTKDFKNRGAQHKHIRYYIDHLDDMEIAQHSNNYILTIKVTRTELRKGLTDNTHERKICIPTIMLPSIFHQAHSSAEAGHAGRDRILAKIGVMFFHPHLKTWIQALMNDCIPCQRNGAPMKRSHTAPIQDWSLMIYEIFHTVHVDTKVGLTPPSNDNTAVLAITDAHSKYTVAMPMKSTKAIELWKALTRGWIRRFGPMKVIVCDNGSEFMNREFLEIVNSHGITLKPRQVYNPQSNGTVENRMRQLTTYMRKNSNENFDNWSQLLKPFCFTLNTQFNHTIAMTPHEVVYGQKARTTLEEQLEINLNVPRKPLESLHLPRTTQLIEQHRIRNVIFSTTYEINRQNKLQKQKFEDHTSRALPLKVGDRVFAEDKTHRVDRRTTDQKKVSKKLMPRRIGPYKIIRTLGPVNYVLELESSKKERKVHRNDIIQYTPITEVWNKLLEKSNTIDTDITLTQV
jgi:hypothetical protein